MDKHPHLTLEERYQIEMLLRLKISREEIGKRLSRPRCTIDREIRRNRGSNGYQAVHANELARARLRSRARANPRRIDPAIWPKVYEALAERWSPEQIAGRLRLTEDMQVSYESIYTHIYAEKRHGGTLWRLLPSQKSRRKRCGAGHVRRHLIPNRVPIEDRPDVVERKARFGDWEGDTIVDATQRDALVSLVERSSMYILLAKVSRRTTDQVCNAIIDAFTRLGAPAHTLTLDNGSEFCAHHRITRALGTRCYFAKPYAAWQRGLNENHNGLVRRYIPKRASLANYTQSHLDLIAQALNNRPRKSLAYLTPHEHLLTYFSRKSRALRS
jgi:IS30 family transposase